MLLYFLGWFIGVIAGSYFLIQPLIIICFSVPFTLKLRKLNALEINDPVMKRDVISITIQLVILAISFFLMRLTAHNLYIGFIVGLGFTLLFGVGKILKNTSNVADYMENNFRFIHPEFMKQYVQTISSAPDSKEKDIHLLALIKKSDSF